MSANEILKLNEYKSEFSELQSTLEHIRRSL